VAAYNDDNDEEQALLVRLPIRRRFQHRGGMAASSSFLPDATWMNEHCSFVCLFVGHHRGRCLCVLYCSQNLVGRDALALTWVLKPNADAHSGNAT
jgi:hypothetical protein